MLSKLLYLTCVSVYLSVILAALYTAIEFFKLS